MCKNKTEEQTVLISKGKGKVVFKKDWHSKYMSSNFDSLNSYKLMLCESATNIQGVLLNDISEKCFKRIKQRSKQPT